MTNEDIDKFRAAITAARDAEHAEIVELVREHATRDDVDETFLGAELRLRRPFELTDSHYGRRQITALRVKCTMFTAPDEEPFAEVHGYGHPLTASGQRHATKAPGWMSLPEELSEFLIELADPEEES